MKLRVLSTDSISCARNQSLVKVHCTRNADVCVRRIEEAKVEEAIRIVEVEVVVYHGIDNQEIRGLGRTKKRRTR